MSLKKTINYYIHKPSRAQAIGYLSHELFNSSLIHHLEEFEELYPAATLYAKSETASCPAYLPSSWACPPINRYTLKDVHAHSSHGIVYLKKINSYVEEFSWGWGKYRTNKLRASIRDRKISEYRSEVPAYIFTGKGYHGLTEDISAVLELKRAGADFNIIIERTNAWMLNVLDYFGLPLENIKPVEPDTWIHASKGIFLTKSPHAEYIHPNLLGSLREMGKKNSQSFSAAKKIFVSRQDAPSRYHRREEKFFKGLSEKSYTRIELAKLPVSEQIGLFSNAEAIAGFHGAGLSNMVWCKNSIKITEFFSSKHFNPCYYSLARALNHEYQSINADEHKESDG